MSRTVGLLGESESLEIDNLMPGNQNARLGDRLKELQDRGLIMQQVAVIADATGGMDFVVEHTGILLDVMCLCTVANVAGTMIVNRVAAAISSAMIAAVQDVVTLTTDIVHAEKLLAAGETLNITANGAADRAIVTLFILRT